MYVICSRTRDFKQQERMSGLGRTIQGFRVLGFRVLGINIGFRFQGLGFRVTLMKRFLL